MCTSCDSSFTSCFRPSCAIRHTHNLEINNRLFKHGFSSPSLFVIYRGEVNGQSLVQRPLSSPLAKPLHSFSRNLNTSRKRHCHGYDIHRICCFIGDANRNGFDAHCQRRCSIAGFTIFNFAGQLYGALHTGYSSEVSLIAVGNV